MLLFMCNENISLISKETALKLNILKLGMNACNIIKEVHNKSFPKIKNVQVQIKLNKEIKPVC